MRSIRPRVALFEPRIPQNVGNIGRSCLAFGLKLDLIEPLGFDLSDKHLKRAGLDYWKNVEKTRYRSYQDYRNKMTNLRIIGFSKNGNKNISEFEFYPNDIFLFGREDNGLTDNVRESCYDLLTIPMPRRYELKKDGVRSLNLAVACGIVIYTACEQLNLLDSIK